MATNYDEFTLQNLAGMTAALGRIPATKAAIAQDAFLTQRAQQQAALARKAQTEEALKVFDIEQRVREKAATRAREATQAQAEEMFLLQQAAQMVGEERRARRDVAAIGEKAKAFEAAQDQILSAKEPEIKQAWENIADEHAAEQAEITRATAPIRIKPEDVLSRFLSSESGPIEMAKLTPEQQKWVNQGNVAKVIQKLGPQKTAGLALGLETARQEMERAAAELQKQSIDILQDQIKARPFNSGAQAKLLLQRYPGAEKFRPKRLAPTATEGSNEKKAGLPGRPVAALSPEETEFFPELYGGKQGGTQPANYVKGIIPSVVDAFTSVPSAVMSGVAGSDPGLAISDVVRALQNKYANARTALFGGVPQPAPASSGAIGRLTPTVDPSQSIMARTAGALMPSKANVFNLLRQLGISSPGTVSPWQTGAEAFMVDPRMQPVNPFAPQVATEIPEAYFSIGR